MAASHFLPSPTPADTFVLPPQTGVGLAERGIVFACYTPSVCLLAGWLLQHTGREGTLLTTIEKQCLNVGSKVGNCHLDD